MTTQLDTPTATAADLQETLAPVDIYERFAVPALFAPAAERLLAAAQPRRGERVLDVGAGTGVVARQAARHVAPDGAVVGLDVSPEMLAVARAASTREGLAIAWQEGRAEELPFPDARFDLVVSQFALMFFAREAAIAEMRRVLVPGGRVAAAVFQEIERHPLYVALDHAVARRLGTSPIGEIFALGDAGALAADFARAGFRDVAVAPFSLTAHLGPAEQFLAGELAIDTAAIPAMRGLAASDQLALAEAIAVEMAEPLRAVTVDGEVVIEFHALIATATR
jgi:ubiquinone/menaquinone biosynthesis C-methylase UbiE